MPVPPFDENGYLEPGRHGATVVEVKTALVDAFPDSENRATLFGFWITHLQTLSYLVPIQSQWLGGSFVSTKRDPGDVDSVSLVDGTALDQMPEPQRRLVEYMCSGPGSKGYWLCDAYYVAIYPPEHPYFELMNDALAYWDDKWGHARSDADDERIERGYLEIFE